MAFRLFSSAFAEGGWVPELHTCQGADLAPPLEWSGEPANTRSFTLVVDDPDAPHGTFTHWVLLDLDPKTKSIAKRVKHIRIWIDKKTYLTTKFEYTEGDGDTTRYEFTNIRINEPIAHDKFVLNLPPSVRVEQMKVQ